MFVKWKIMGHKKSKICSSRLFLETKMKGLILVLALVVVAHGRVLESMLLNSTMQHEIIKSLNIFS